MPSGLAGAERGGPTVGDRVCAGDAWPEEQGEASAQRAQERDRGDQQQGHGSWP